MRDGVCKLCRAETQLLNGGRLSSIVTAGKRKYSSQVNHGQTKIAVLGGGITGLASAYYLQKYKPRSKVTLFESSDRLGGWLMSKRLDISGDSILFEAGPRSLRTVDNGILAAQLIDDLKMHDQVIYTSTKAAASNHRYIYYPDRLVRMPHPTFGFLDGIMTILREPAFAGAFRAIFREATAMPLDASIQDLSIGEFLSARFDARIVDNIVSAIFHGIYAGDVYQLSARSLMPRLFRDAHTIEGILAGAIKSRNLGVEMSRENLKFYTTMQQTPLDPVLKRKLAKSSVYTFTEGIGALVDGLARYLWSTDSVEIRTGAQTSSLKLAQDGRIEVNTQKSSETFDHVVSALSPAHLNSLMTEASNKIPEVPSVTVMTVNMFYKNPIALPPGPGPDQLGFGYLIPRGVPFEQNPERALGVVFDHAYAPPQIGKDTAASPTQDRLSQPGSKLTVMLGGHWWDGWPSYPTADEGLELAMSLLRRHLGIQQRPDAWEANLNKDCIPQYTVGHEDRLKTAHANLERAFKGKLSVAGSWIGGVGVNDCLRSAWNVSQSLARGDQGTGLENVGATDYVRVHTSSRKS